MLFFVLITLHIIKDEFSGFFASFQVHSLVASNEELKDSVGFLVTLVYGVLALCVVLLITLFWRTYNMESICNNSNKGLDFEELAENVKPDL